MRAMLGDFRQVYFQIPSWTYMILKRITETGAATGTWTSRHRVGIISVSENETSLLEGIVTC